MVHELKTDMGHFQAVLDDNKTCEIRFNDRNFKLWDILVLRETQATGEQMKRGMPLIYTGREIRAWVTHIIRGPECGIAAGWVVMSIKLSSRARIK
ncbi:MAG: DUF3850 domain-containing protein [Smithella sp.]